MFSKFDKKIIHEIDPSKTSKEFVKVSNIRLK